MGKHHAHTCLAIMLFAEKEASGNKDGVLTSTFPSPKQVWEGALLAYHLPTRLRPEST